MSEHQTRDDDEEGPGSAPVRSWYEVLEVERDASSEEIEAAYQRAVRLIDGKSLGGYLMLDPSARESARSDVEAAYLVLSDPEERARFDAQLGAESAPSSAAGRRARRRRKREEARRARAASRPQQTELPMDEAAATVPSAPAEEDDFADPSSDADTVVTEASEEASAPTLISDASEEHSAEPEAASERERAEPSPSTPPGRVSKRPQLRFLSPVVEEEPLSATEPPSSDPPRPSSGLRLSSRPPTKAADAEPSGGRRPWLYSDAGTEGVAERPRVLEGEHNGEDPNQSLPPESEINGGVIKRLREAKGITLEELAEQTHIRKDYLRAIESQSLDELPARVYLRGFLTQIARVLKVDKKHLAEGYMSFVERYRR